MKKAITIAIFCLLFGMVFAMALPKQDAGDKGPLTKVTFIHYKNGDAKPAGPAKSKPINCYGFLASGAKWKIIEPYFVNPENSGLDGSFVGSAVNAAVAEWETHGGNIFGVGSIDDTAAYNDSLDGKNTASFGLYSDPNVIAITSVWGYFGGSPKSRALVEWDMLFNTHFTFGDATPPNSALMDLQNIATHEMGHSAGMDDLYNTACYSETMYGYSTEGETSKRDLYTGDIAGIKKLYGS